MAYPNRTGEIRISRGVVLTAASVLGVGSIRSVYSVEDDVSVAKR